LLEIRFGSIFRRSLVQIRSRQSNIKIIAFSPAIVDALDKAGKKVQITFEDPDTFIIVETAGNRAGLELIRRAMRERYPFIRVK
jgi:hypothetical protein